MACSKCRTRIRNPRRRARASAPRARPTPRPNCSRMERLRDSSNVALDPATTKGTFVAQVALDHTLTGALTKDNLNYTIDADITNFSAEKWVRGQKVEAAALKLTANTQGLLHPRRREDRRPAGDGRLSQARRRHRCRGAHPGGARRCRARAARARHGRSAVRPGAVQAARPRRQRTSARAATRSRPT